MTKSTMTVNDEGMKLWKNSSGELHRLDGPAVEYADGTKCWYQNGQRHRVVGPAVEWYDGHVAWWYKSNFLGNDLKGFWRLWDRLDEEARQNVNLHMWLRKLTNV